MRKTLLITFCIFLLFILEFMIANIFGNAICPNLIILAVIYFNFTFGIRYGIVSAILAGLIKDSFGLEFFGLNIFGFMLCVYIMSLIKPYIYHRDSSFSRFLLVLIIVLINIFIQYALHFIYQPVEISQVLKYILLPEIVMTLIAMTSTFKFLQKCVLKFYV